MKTLEEKIRPHARYWDCYNDEPEVYNHTGKLIKIADEFAIDFAEWLIENKILSSKMPLKELLDMFKKEKGISKTL
jgi:hypothetical protein